MSATDATRLLQLIDAIQKKVTELKTDADLGREESSDQIQARITRADTAARHRSAGDKPRRTRERAPSRWQQMCAEAAAKARAFEDRLYQEHDDLEARHAAGDPELAETDALDALDFAWWALDRAQVAVLNAVDARARANERAAAAHTAEDG